MDAAEHDLDAKLYKASAVLLEEIKHKVPLLLTSPHKPYRKPRLLVLDTKCNELRALLDRFQEWPQLLDPYLASLVQILANAFIDYLANSKHHYGPTTRSGAATTSPLPRAVCRLLYTFCKVRGYKVIVRLLNNEPRYLAPMLSGFRAWNDPASGMTWEERYIMLLWLSHLMLAPFELANMSIEKHDRTEPESSLNLGVLPGIASDVVPLAFSQLQSSGKEQQAACILLVRLVLRKDMQEHLLPAKIIDFAVQQLLFDQTLTDVSPYRALGLLSLLYGILNSGSDSEVAPFLQQILHCVSKIASAHSGQHKIISDFAPARKLLLKIMRVILTHGISLSQANEPIPEDVLNLMLEEGIQFFMDVLSDKDAPVRMSAAKALSIIALRLNDAMSAEVIEAVLESLQENVLLEDSRTQKLLPFTDRVRSETSAMKRNISAVDPLKWHGLMLSLSHFLFRRSPPPSMLNDIIHALILGLEFEQRSFVGTSIGVGVRDAACFGLWALARKYSTSELASVDISTYAEARALGLNGEQRVLQLLACKLATSACSDPSGNIRRGSSAALQELIGRHPDTILNGIAIVQTIDYHAVARLSRAMIDVSGHAAELDPVYHRALFQASIEWRGARAVDANQRRWSATIVRTLTKGMSPKNQLQFVHAVQRQLLDLKAINIGSTAGARHGLLLALSSGIESLAENNPSSGLPGFWSINGSNFEPRTLTGNIEGRLSSDIELVIEGISTLIATIARFIPDDFDEQNQGYIPSACAILAHCTGSSRKDWVVEASSNANLQVIKYLPNGQSDEMLKTWLNPTNQASFLYMSRGWIRTLSLVHGCLTQEDRALDIRRQILEYLVKIIEGKFWIETRVDAMEGLTLVLSDMPLSIPEDATLITTALVTGLTDYTNDQRGDVGSTLRLQTLEAVDAFRRTPFTTHEGEKLMEEVLPHVVKLSAEKLSSVRFRAWKVLEASLGTHSVFQNRKTFGYLTEVTSIDYFRNLLQLLSLDWAREALVLGLFSSATAGIEDICRAACNAFVTYLQDLTSTTRRTLVHGISSLVLEQLELRVEDEDRAILPLVEFLCFFISQELFSNDLLAPTGPHDILATMSKLQLPTSSLPRIEALLSLYSHLLTIFPITSNQHTQCLDKMTRQLLHRWPRVRNMAADLLYLHRPSGILMSCDWNGTMAVNKPFVLDLRKELGVVGKASAAKN
ncbi:hypothetical protein LTR84_010120 [Exophiala bonariae]|uniref:Tubulin-specific chaperone D C-terminal domain-containing protein n=1 Tax=Exophiala bonariae TaxID=1690606 RepID=A0AAV9NMV8_9EURO|nr:hypothetical protein LTR84_010120 [Exophiala bonariae]